MNILLILLLLGIIVGYIFLGGLTIYVMGRFGALHADDLTSGDSPHIGVGIFWPLVWGFGALYGIYLGINWIFTGLLQSAITSRNKGVVELTPEMAKIMASLELELNLSSEYDDYRQDQLKAIKAELDKSLPRSKGPYKRA